MSREIKFRAWHKERREMFNVLSLTLSELNGRGLQAELNNGHITIWAKLSKIELLRYIGINDICEKEACEDDIIKFDETGIGGLKGQGRIFYCTNLLIVPAPGYYLELSNRTISARFPFNFQIIGNFYENPELLAE